MADRIKLRRGSKNKIDLNVYELGYVTDSDEERLYFNNGSMVPIPNNKDITDIKTELTEATNVSIQNKKDVIELKESVSGIIKTGVAKLVQYSYDIELSETTQKVNIPYERYSSITDTLKVYVNGLAIQNDQYTITDPVENEGIVTKGYIVLKAERPAGTIVRMEVWKNVPSGEEGEVSGNIISQNSLPLNRIIGIDDIISQLNTIEKSLDAQKTQFINVLHDANITGTQKIALPFKPKAIFITALISDVAGAISNGYCDENLNQNCGADFNRGMSGSYNGNSIYIIYLLHPNGNDVRGKITALEEDGFTIDWSLLNSNDISGSVSIKGIAIR